MNIFITNMEGNGSVKRYYNDIKCKLGSEHEEKLEEINKCFEQFKEQYRKADSKKDFYKENDIKTNGTVIYNLKLLLDMFNWDDDITIEKINKIAKLQKKKPEHLLNTILRRIENYEDNRR